ncbi:MAG: signal peptidase I [Chitinispirillaceae bacterium]|nr:signal peptidase I [Chitinispirillaceae bacterium]
MPKEDSMLKSEKAGIFRFGREMTSALVMALIFIVYVIQAFKIPSASMEKSLLTGDFLLGLKFLYGSPVVPFSYVKFPRISSPKPGDVVIFEFPGNDFEIGNSDFLNKDFIKRCVAGPGQTVEIRGRDLYVDGHDFVLPPHGQFVRNGELDYPGITAFAPLRIPKKNDTITVEGLDAREFFFLRNLIAQENPGSRVAKFWTGTAQPFLRAVPFVRSFLANRPRGNPEMGRSFPRVAMDFSLYIDGKKTDTVSLAVADAFGRPRVVPFSKIKRQLVLSLNDSRFATWKELERNLDFLLAQLRERLPDRDVSIRKELYLRGKKVTRYIVRNDNYFMMGDNRDDSMDSRYWGYVNRNFVKAKAFILYFSLDSRTSWLLLPLKIRWNRMGKLIRSWNGLEPPDYYK